MKTPEALKIDQLRAQALRSQVEQDLKEAILIHLKKAQVFFVFAVFLRPACLFFLFFVLGEGRCCFWMFCFVSLPRVVLVKGDLPNIM